MSTYKLGRNAIASLPGVDNEDIKDVTVNVNAEQLDVTVFKATAIDKAEYMAGLVDVTIDVMCTATTAEVGDIGECDVANLPTDLQACVLNVSEKVTPRGMVEYTVSYGLVEPLGG